MISIKGSKVSIPEVLWMSRSPPSSCTGTLHRGLILQSHLQAGNLISQLLFISSMTSMEEFISFAVEGDIFILLVWVATKVYNTRCCSSRQAIISHPQGYSSAGEGWHLAGLCFSFSLLLDSLLFLLAEEDLRVCFSKFMSISPAKRRVTRSIIFTSRKFVTVKSGVNVVKFDYLLLRTKQIS